jgi:hypothetical protein
LSGQQRKKTKTFRANLISSATVKKAVGLRVEPKGVVLLRVQEFCYALVHSRRGRPTRHVLSYYF